MKQIELDIKNSEKTIVERIMWFADNYPDKAAIICNDEITTYSDLKHLILCCRCFLKNAGIKHGDRVVVQSVHDKYCVALYYAVHSLGAILVPLDKNAPEIRAKEIAKEIEATIVISYFATNISNWYTYLQVTQCNTINELDEVLIYPDIDDICEMIFTTGTTGKSKGVLITHRSISWYAYAIASTIQMKQNNRFLITAALNHASGLRRTHLSLANGCSVVYLDGITNLKKYFEYMKKYCVTSLYLSPVAVRFLISTAKNELNSFKDQVDFVYSSSSPLLADDCEQLRKILPNTRLYNAYEASETPGVSAYDYNSNGVLSGCMGLPNPGVMLGVLDDNGNIIDNPGIEGQICVKSPMNMKGYYNAPDLTAKVMKGDWYVSSDLGEFDESGNIYFKGRKGDVINMGGLKVSPTDVEEVALLSGLIQECICILAKNRNGHSFLKLLVVADNTLDTKQLKQFINERLEKYKVPKEIELVEEIHKTFNGKIDRKFYR